LYNKLFDATGIHEIIEKVAHCASNWKKYARESGVNKNIISAIDKSYNLKAFLGTNLTTRNKRDHGISM